MGLEFLTSAFDTFSKSVAPPPVMRYSVWAEQNIRLPSTSAISGRYKPWKYQRIILDAMGDPLLERVTVIKPTRIGYTRMLCAALGADAANDPCSVIFLTPTDDDATETVKDEIEPTFAESPAIASLMAIGKYTGGDTLTNRKFAGGGTLKVRSARSPRNLSRLTARKVYCDEVDRYEITKEGDPVAIVTKRTESFADRKIILGSTPTEKTVSIISKAYDESDQRVFEVPCPECGHRFELLWEHINRDDPKNVVAICPESGCIIDERHKPSMVEAGEFRITKPEVEGHAGFRLNALVSLQPKAAWGVLAREFAEAKRDGPAKMQVFWNTVLGLAWDLSIDIVDEASLLARREGFGIKWDEVTQEWREDIPREVLYITAGVDVQPDRLEVVLIGFSRKSRYILGHIVIRGLTTLASTWEKLDAILLTTWTHPLGGQIGIEAAAVDSGDGNMTGYVYDFCGPRSARRIYAIKGRGGSHPPWKFTTSRRARRSGAQLALVGVDTIKGDILTSMSIPTDGLNGFRFSDELTEDWFKQYTAERRKVEYVRGRPVITFERIGYRAAEALDCVVYGLAVRAICTFRFDDRQVELIRHSAPAAKVREERKKKIGRLNS
ncbi:MAG: phage terminase large subunit family protein [Burkholderiales bacterium]|nr:phage terminase large subunit family protein [Burkholderiales bacterium]